MSKRTISKASPSATSSPESGSGPTPSVEPGGQMTDLFGRVQHPASRSASLAPALGLQMHGISGPSGSPSFRSECLSRSLVSRLMVVTEGLGSTLFGLTWKALVTPSGRWFSLLRASGVRTGVIGCTSWVTPSTRDWKDSPGMAVTSVNPDGSPRRRVDQLPRQARLVVLGGGLPGCPAAMDLDAPFNPEHSRWLMGLPPEWSSCAPTVTRSSRRSPSSSSGPTLPSGGSDGA